MASPRLKGVQGNKREAAFPARLEGTVSMPATSTASIRVRDEVAALKRERTIDVAAELFYERGYENTSLDVIAEHMGVTKPFIYAHFSSKAELLAEICSRGIAASLQAMTVVLERPGKPAALLAEMCRLFVRAVLDNQRHIAIFAREEKNLAPEDFKRRSPGARGPGRSHEGAGHGHGGRTPAPLRRRGTGSQVAGPQVSRPQAPGPPGLTRATPPPFPA